MRETWVQSLGQEGPQGEEMATHSGILAWGTPQTEEPGGLQFMGSQRVWCNRKTNTFTFFCTAWALGLTCFSSCGAWVYLLFSMWDFLVPGIELLFPALEGGFYTTEPPGKPHSQYVIITMK